MPSHEVRAVHLPYCIQRQPDGRYVILNRDYKPLGFRTQERVEYGDYPVSVKLKGLTKRLAAQLSWEGSSDLDKIHLYDDGCVPTDSAKKMQAYMQRLSILAKLKISA